MAESTLQPKLFGTARLGKACYFHYWPDFDCAETRGRNPCGNADRLVEIPGVDQEVATELFARLHKRSVGHQRLVVPHADAGCRRRGMQGGGGQILPARAELLRKLRGLTVTFLANGLLQGFLVKVNQQHVSHAYPFHQYVERRL